MTTTIKVNVMGFNLKWQSGQGKEYYTGDFIFQQVSPSGPVLMTEDGSLNLNALDISDDVDIVYRWKSPFVAIDGVLYPAAFSLIAEDNFWVLPGNAKPNKANVPQPGGQFTVTFDAPDELRVSDKNSDAGDYTYCLALKVGIDVDGSGNPAWLIADPKITNRGSTRLLALESAGSAR
ncbi:hypothetical protein K3163_01525 [Qipengyuania sp. 1NDW9]|uniref:hypothetical protein n=1 Tax=Qipengyuania xiapuensis TaxID=2867236 RepID=UPI001C8715FA|nr:hypothetical protein [Qipengyuania xiapuensis]MBX7491883.1 hypothetical protein [Qipengyuania xiapuensis]